MKAWEGGVTGSIIININIKMRMLKMKKLISGILAVLMVTSISTPAFAETTQSPIGTYKASDGGTIIVSAGTNAGGHPDDELGDYNFNIENKMYYQDVDLNGALDVFGGKKAIGLNLPIDIPYTQFVHSFKENGEVACGLMGTEPDPNLVISSDSISSISPHIDGTEPVLLRDNDNNLYWAAFQSKDSSIKYCNSDNKLWIDSLSSIDPNAAYYYIIKKYTRVSSQIATSIDTGKKLAVKAGKTYQFKVTSSTKPTLVCGTGSVFKCIAFSSNGNNYYFKFKAIGKVGQCAGFYLNHSKTPCTVGTIY